ncbi:MULTISPECIES: hypothetical protein [unclassified Caballeronia]|uniref:hypothetical protein n=1 Tax=unclassified Caballeronia TaxID=2646786 RepID=UPI0028574169|nr:MULTISPECIES: hypothetical protein [unclassified Caballeronia]MDR5777668.1 hypothetical protein [Caballeronia sp. LZ002]MDR5853106.1 hypothetical protein [Caballeronia sp. LZ003]
MRRIVLLCLVFSLGTGTARAASMADDGDLKKNLSSLEKQCQYQLDENLINRISKSSSKVDENVISIDFYLTIRPAKRDVEGKLTFACLTTKAEASEQKSLKKTTASAEIALEDSGGRYAREVAWQRKFEGQGWNGTIAYVNAVYGDQRKQRISDYFLICPDKNELTCFSFEIVKFKLSKRESNRIPEALLGIEIVNYRKSR